MELKTIYGVSVIIVLTVWLTVVSALLWVGIHFAVKFW